LVTALRPKDRCRIYEARSPGGSIVNASVILYSNDLAYYWQGFPNFSTQGVNVQTLIHWEVLKDLIDQVPRDTLTGYDLMEANSQGACRLTSQFGTLPTSYYRIETSGIQMRLAKNAYQLKRAIESTGLR
jgi:hypothetical protein